jgi:hypothetical protein
MYCCWRRWPIWTLRGRTPKFRSRRSRLSPHQRFKVDGALSGMNFMPGRMMLPDPPQTRAEYPTAVCVKS